MYIKGEEENMGEENNSSVAIELKEKPKARIIKLDNLKFFLIFLVVLGHIFEEVIAAGNANWDVKRARFFIYLFHMPLFLFVSGIFSKKNIDNKRYKNIFYYLILFYVGKIIFFICDIIFKEKYSFSMFLGTRPPWYCLALFICSLMTIFLKQFNKKYVFIFSIILGCLVGYDSSVSDFLALSRVIVFFPFFFAGYCLDEQKLIKILSSKKIKIAAIILLLLFMILIYVYIKDIYWMNPLLSGRNPFSKLKGNAELGGILRLGYYIANMILGASIISLIPSGKKVKIFADWGARSLQVYMLHYIIIYILFRACNMKFWIDKITLPHKYLILPIPIALLITIFFSLKIWEKPFGVLKKYMVKEKKA